MKLKLVLPVPFNSMNCPVLVNSWTSDVLRKWSVQTNTEHVFAFQCLLMDFCHTSALTCLLWHSLLLIFWIIWVQTTDTCGFKYVLLSLSVTQRLFTPPHLYCKNESRYQPRCVGIWPMSHILSQTEKTRLLRSCLNSNQETRSKTWNLTSSTLF